MKTELLSPAGNMEALKAAIHNGADAIYLAGKKYGARKYAENFSNEEIIEAIKYAHLYDVKVYVTANTLIYEEEVDDFLNYIKFLYENNVDAVLMQDIGMISLIRKLIPDLEIHASTQSHNCNNETLKLLKSLGVKRVVLARELSLEEINKLDDDIEKEVFAYGALCICYSGCCLMSSFLGGRSGNRGMCAGPCRLPYSLIMDNREILSNKYLLSTKELNTTTKLKELLNSNIQSLKIEGRMKSPEYVGYVTKVFRSIIDNKKIENFDINLKKLFNRGFTTGHLFKDEIINSKAPNHQGIKIGDIVATNKFIKIKLTDSLRQNDGIRLIPSKKGMIVNKMYNKDYKLINKANKGEIIYLENKFNIKNDTTILKTFDYDLSKAIKKYNLKELPVTLTVKAFKNKPLVIKMRHQELSSTYTGDIISEAKNCPSNKEDITKHLNKLGNSPFTLKNINIKMDDNIFIPVKQLNETKRFLVNDIIEKKTSVNKKVNFNVEKIKMTHSNTIKISAYSDNEEILKYLLKNTDRVYTSNFNLYKKYKNKKLYYKLPRTSFNLPDLENENLLITELGSFYKYSKNNNTIVDSTLNITNSFSAGFFKSTYNISTECNPIQIKNILNYTNEAEILIYGRKELMIMNYCIIKDNMGCKYCKHKFELKNKDNIHFPIINKHCKNKILSPIINDISKIGEYHKYGINNFRFDFYNETLEEVKNILNMIKARV